LGIGNGMIGLVSKQENADKRVILFNGLITLSIISAIYVFVLLILAKYQGSRIIDKTSFAEVDTFSSALFMVCFLGLLHNFGNMGLKYRSAIGNYNFTVYFETFSVLAGITSAFILLSFQVNLLFLVVGLIGVPTFLSTCHLFFLFRGFKLHQEFSRVSSGIKNRIFHLLVQGRLFFILQITTVVSLQIDSLFIGAFLGPNEVASTAITWKLFSVPYLLLVSASGGLWALASSKVGVRSDLRFEELIWRNIKYAFGYSIVFGMALMGFGRNLVHAFSPNLPTPSNSMLLISWLLLISMCVGQPISMILNGLHKERFLITTSLIGMCVNFVASVSFLKIFEKGYGALLGTALAQILCFIVPTLAVYQPWKNRNEGV
jgi:O-antigen/teichoic acid export membrane protein